MANKRKDVDDETLEIAAAIADDMPDDDDIELMENGLGADGEKMSTADQLYDGSHWDPDRPARSSIPARDWLGP